MRARALRIAVLVPRCGPAGLWAPSCEASALLAGAEINTFGGPQGRAVELIIRDAGPTDDTAVEATSRAIDLDAVDALVAMVPSSARRLIHRTVRGRIPFLYTPQFEGRESRSDIITIGETAEELLRPSIDWLVTEKHASRFFLVGNDYLWPQRSMAEARRVIADCGGSVVGQVELPFSTEEHDQTLKQIERARPHVVLFWLLGHEAVVFNRAFAASGLAARILRFSTAVDETILYGIGEDCTENLYVSSAYFANLRSRNNDAFLEKYHTAFGDSPAPPNAFGESLYEGIHCLSGLMAAADTTRASDLSGLVGRSPQKHTARGFARDVATGSRHPIHIAAVEGLEFKLLASRG